MEHLGTRILETDRLILRPFTSEDTEAMYRNWASDPGGVKISDLAGSHLAGGHQPGY